MGSEKEAITRINFDLFQLDNSHGKGKLNIIEIADYLPAGIVINDINCANRFLNKSSESLLNLTMQASIELGPDYGKQILYDCTEYEFIYEKVRRFHEQNDDTAILSYFQQLKPIGSDKPEWMYITSKLFRRVPGEEAHERLLIACPVKNMGDMAGKIDKLLDENIYMKKNFHKFSTLTKREKEIIIALTSGQSSNRIAEKLFISRHTVDQHRKNIHKKLEVRNITELIKFARVFELEG